MWEIEHAVDACLQLPERLEKPFCCSHLFFIIPCEGFTGSMGEALSGIEMNKINEKEEKGA